jgi:uncharacterized protein (TIGR01777 family)
MATRIAISGSSGMIGAALVGALSQAGHSITRIVRDARADDPNGRVVKWDPANGRIDRAGLEDHDAVVHLAGENIAAGRWTDRRKATIRESRIRSTALLADTLASLSKPPRLLLTASAIGYYGNREPHETVDETSAPGAGFLSDLCRDWERAAAPAQAAGIRVVHTRFGIVLSPRGGALAQMLPIFKLGIGGKVGSGRQIMSWISLAEIPSVVLHLIEKHNLSGPINCVTPNPVSNAEFTRTLGRALGRPTIAPLPAFAARIMFGEMADELLLGGVRVHPRRLSESGYTFRYPDLERALQNLLS